MPRPQIPRIEQLRVKNYRDEKGFTQAKRAADMRGIPEFMAKGATLGNLWMENYFEFGNPLRNQGSPR